jgi:hypothetical protein
MRLVKLLPIAFLLCGCPQGNTDGGTTPQQVEKDMFTVEQVICMGAAIVETQTTGNVQSVANTIQQACGIAPTLTQEVISFIGTFSAKRAQIRAMVKRD